MPESDHVKDALDILSQLGLPRAQQNNRSALCLLALLNLPPDKEWREVESPLMGITPMMEFASRHYGKQYAPNSRETFRRQTIHQSAMGRHFSEIAWETEVWVAEAPSHLIHFNGPRFFGAVLIEITLAHRKTTC